MFNLLATRDICTQGSVNSYRDLRICTAQRNLYFGKQTAENGGPRVFSSEEVVEAVEPNAELYRDNRKYNAILTSSNLFLF